MASKPRKKRISCKATISISTPNGQKVKCSSKVLKGKAGEFEQISQMIRETLAESGDKKVNFKLFWVKSDETQILIENQDKLQGKLYYFRIVFHK